MYDKWLTMYISVVFDPMRTGFFFLNQEAVRFGFIMKFYLNKNREMLWNNPYAYWKLFYSHC